MTASLSGAFANDARGGGRNLAAEFEAAAGGGGGGGGRLEQANAGR